MVAILLIFSGQAIQEWVDVLRRDNEAEMMFRAQEIVRAMFRFQQENGRLPTELRELMEPGPKGQYFLRHQYDDPLVKDGKWGLLFAGPGGQIVDPNSDRVSYGEELGSVSTAETQTVGGLRSSRQGPQEIGGLPLAGVKTLSSDKPFRVYRGLSDYSQWQFTIYDLQNLQTPGQSAGQVRPGDPANRGRRPGSPAGGRAPRNLPGRSGGGGN
jgi:hypothetical protein